MITPADLDEMQRWAKATWPVSRESLDILKLIAEVRRLRALLNLAVGANRPRADGGATP